jgi:hypothetical protein
LASTEITSSTANVIFDGYLDNTDYKYFQIIYNNLTGASGTTTYMRYVFRDGGADITSAGYNRHFIDSGSWGYGATSQWVNGTLLEANVTVNNAGTNVASGDLCIYHTNDSSSEGCGTFRQLCSQTDGNMRLQQGGFGHTNNQTIDGIKFYAIGDNFENANFRLYGIKP